MLSTRQLEALVYVSQGLSPKQIATIMAISKSSVETHLLRARDHLGANNTPHLVALAYQSGILK